MSFSVLTTLSLPALTTNSIYPIGNITVGTAGSGVYSTGGTSTMAATTGSGYTGQIYTTTSTAWNNITNTYYSTTNPPLYVKDDGLLEIKGDNADILINGVSLKKTLDCINDRLGMMRPNLKIESEWDKLLELGNQYRKLEADIKEKMYMWDLLKKEY